MLGIDPGKVVYVLVKAREFDAREEADVDEGSSDADDDERSVLIEGPNDVILEEFRGVLESLNEDELTNLLALTWLGRGDYEAEDWEDCLQEAESTLDDKAIAYLLGIPLLSDYLEEGLSRLEYSVPELEAEHL